MTISSSSTLADCQAAYLDNCGYREQRSLTMARAFCSACRAILLLMPQSAAQGGDQTISFNIPAIRAQLDDAQGWIAMNSAGNGSERVVGTVSPNFRGLYGPFGHGGCW